MDRLVNYPKINGISGLRITNYDTGAKDIYIQASISPGIIIFGILFSFGVGCLSGFFPAKGAAKLKPVEALRYE